MQPSDIIATTALLLSVLTFFFSLFTFFWANLRKAKFASTPIHTLTIDVSEAKENEQVPTIWIKALLAVTNYGGSSGVIESLRLCLQKKDGTSIEFLAYTELPQQDMSERPPKSQMPVLPNPFALAPGESVIRHIWFMGTNLEQRTLKPDTYDFQIYARVLGQKKEVLLQTQRIIIRTELVPNYNIAHWVLRGSGQTEIG
jgi:hypothetical protein